MKSGLKIFFILLILFFSFVFILAKSYSDRVFTNISSNFIRLHVVANSDSTEDQIVKYKIRDSVISYLSPYLTSAKSKQQAEKIINDKIQELYSISDNILKEEGLNSNIKISFGNYKFPTKDYSKFILPEGNYDALKIEIGDAVGQNWWCVMFPSLCVTNNCSFEIGSPTSEEFENNLTEEELSILTKDTSSTDIKIKFKILELFENL